MKGKNYKLPPKFMGLTTETDSSLMVETSSSPCDVIKTLLDLYNPLLSQKKNKTTPALTNYHQTPHSQKQYLKINIYYCIRWWSFPLSP